MVGRDAFVVEQMELWPAVDTHSNSAILQGTEGLWKSKWAVDSVGGIADFIGWNRKSSLPLFLFAFDHFHCPSTSDRWRGFSPNKVNLPSPPDFRTVIQIEGNTADLLYLKNFFIQSDPTVVTKTYFIRRVFSWQLLVRTRKLKLVPYPFYVSLVFRHEI